MKKDLKRKKEEEKKERECDSDDLEELEKDFKILKKLKKGKVTQSVFDQQINLESLETEVPEEEEDKK